jgi:hypothetical protein
MILLGHESSRTSERYMHGKGTHLHTVATNMQVFNRPESVTINS